MVRLVAMIVLFSGIGAGSFYYLLNSFNYFDTVERQFGGQCQAVTGLAGPEDMQIDPAKRRVFISALDRRDENARGAIHVFDVDDPLNDTGWRDRTAGKPEAFRPLGIYHYRDEDHERVFVANQAGQSIEVYDVAENGDFEHVKTLTERRLTSPNDIVAVGPETFYVSNDVKSGRDGFLAKVLFLTRAAAGEVLYVDDGGWKVAADRLRYANGLGLSPDGDTLYVTETSGEALKTFDRNPENGQLSLKETIELNVSPENINIDENGDLWIGASPKPLSIALHGRDPSFAAPSEIIRLDTTDQRAEPVYRDDGKEISAATSAARLGRTLLIGSLFEKKFLICDLPSD